MKEISAKSRMCYLTPELGVVAELMGAMHVFTFEGFEIKIILPTKDQADRTEQHDQVAIATAWKSETPKDPSGFEIVQVNAEVNLNEKILVPEDATNSMKVDIRAFDNDSVNKVKISNIAKQYAEISNNAFQHWIDLLRWSKNYPFLGKQKQSQANSSGWGIYLQDIKTGNNVFNLNNPIHASLIPLVTVSEWELTQERLNDNIELPLYMKFKFDAQESIRTSNYELAIIELALASEIYVKKTFLDYLRAKHLHDKVIEYIQKASISHYLKDFFSQIIVDNEISKFAEVRAELEELIRERNSYMHKGFMKQATLDSSQRYLSAIEDLFTLKKSDI